jgi:hypothetical protein
LLAFVLMISQVCNAVEVARWDFEETSGTTATDGSGQYVATLTGADSLDVDGRFGSGIDFAGDGGTTIDAAGSETFRLTEDFTILLWVKSDVAWGAHTRFVDISAADGGLADSYRLFTHSGDNSDNFKFMSRQDGSNTQNIHTRDMPAETWILLVLRNDLDGDVTMNVLQDGDSVDEAFVAANSESWPTAGSIVYAEAELKFGQLNGTSRKFDGQMDGVAFYDEVLADDHVAAMFYAAGSSEYPLAAGPNPANGATLEATWASLGWRAGDYAVSHDFYFGTSFDDVNNGAEGTFAGNVAMTSQVVGFAGFPAPEGLQPGTTYYWRVDEVNDANVASPWKGDIWSFSIPPKTAYAPVPSDGAESVALDAELSWAAGFDAKLHTVYFGDNFEDVNIATGGTPMGDTTFTPLGPLELAKTYYWRVDEFDPPATYKGEVWSFRTEGTAASPNPVKGAVDISPTPILTWTPGSLAASHEVYFGADADAVANATATSPEHKASMALGEESYDAGKLELETTYYWRVDEVNSTEPGSPWIGNIWSFTTGDFLVVDDFESYDDIDPLPGEPGLNRIFDKWLDGFGTTTNGALVGNDLPPYAEQSIVHDGVQAMIYTYDNNLKTSEATLTLAWPRDWTAAGVTKLSLWFRGDSGNAADRIFVALNGNAVAYHDDPAATQITGWNEWVIDLQAFAGVDLTNVNTITIGFGTKGSPAAGGTGTMYFDDIRLVR